MRVVCLNWKNYLGLGSLYVNRLWSMVDRHLTVPHQFVVVTEDDLPKGRSGWFNKLYLLEMFDDLVLYLDLDVVISGDIDHLVEIARGDLTRIWARDDWSYPVSRPQNGREATINSSVMLWCGKKDMSGADALIPKTHGDQGIITQLMWPNGIRLLPNESISSYKYDMLQGRNVGPICVYHGEPKMHQLKDDPFVSEHWR